MSDLSTPEWHSQLHWLTEAWMQQQLADSEDFSAIRKERSLKAQEVRNVRGSILHNMHSHTLTALPRRAKRIPL